MFRARSDDLFFPRGVRVKASRVHLVEHRPVLLVQGALQPALGRGRELLKFPYRLAAIATTARTVIIICEEQLKLSQRGSSLG